MSDHTPSPARPEPDPAVTVPSPSPLRYPPSPARPARPSASSGEPPARLALNEDWAATVVGLALLALVLTGLLPGWLVP
jgi:hypothetical protein